MKVVIENMVASCKLSGNLDLEKIASSVEGARYQPDVFRGVMLSIEQPACDLFIFGNGTVKLHGVTSDREMEDALRILLETLENRNISLKVSEPLSLMEVVASFSRGSIDPKSVYEEFKGDGIIYDPSELPGFILNVGNKGIEVLIFPEGKIVTRGSDNIPDAVSSLQMVEARISALG